MADFVLKLAPNILLGNYSLARIGEEIAALGSAFMFIVSPFDKNTPFVEKIISALEAKGFSLFIFDVPDRTPDSETLEQALALARGAHIHGVIGCGGYGVGSIARAVAGLYHEKSSVYDILEGEPVSAEALPFVAIPTGCGDPFVFADVCAVSDARNNGVTLVRLHSGICKLSVFDPNSYVNLAPNALKAMVFHGLSIAFEGYISTRSNFFSETILGKAIARLLSVLDPAEQRLSGTSAEEIIAQSACLTAIGIAASAPGLGSALVLSCGARHQVSGSLVAAILLPHIMQDTFTAKIGKIRSIARMLGVDQLAGEDHQAVALAAVDEIRRRLAQANLPTRLKDLDLTIESLVPVAENAPKFSFMNYVPRPVASYDIFEILKQAF